jgi:purine-binding chemotaxis protein CheW
MTQTTTDEVLQLLVFELAGLRYGLELHTVREVARAVLITPLPGAPDVVEGVISVRGEITPIYDFRARFGLPPRPLHPDDFIVLAWTGERKVGVRCERAEWLDELSRSVLAEAPPVALRDGSQLRGVARLEDGLVLIHDLAAFLADAEAAALDRALRERTD